MNYGLVDGGYRLSPEQAQAILDLRLHRLTGLEQHKIIAEYEELIDGYCPITRNFGKPGSVMQVIREELFAIKRIR